MQIIYAIHFFILSAHFIFDVKLCFEIPAFNCTTSMQNNIYESKTAEG